VRSPKGRGFKPHLRKAPERLTGLRTAEGRGLPANILEELQRDMARLALVREQINSIEKIRAARLRRVGCLPSGRSSGTLMLWWWGYSETVSPGPPHLHRISTASAVTSLFRADADATEETIVNALCMAETVIGKDGHTVYAPLRCSGSNRRFCSVQDTPSVRVRQKCLSLASVYVQRGEPSVPRFRAVGLRLSPTVRPKANGRNLFAATTSVVTDQEKRPRYRLRAIWSFERVTH
jgi:hypothetical protein